MQKPKIYFVPHYIGSLKHFERLIPYVGEKYDVGFLAIDKNIERSRALAEYCKNKKYEFKFFDIESSGAKRFRMPFFTGMSERYKQCEIYRNFLNAKKPQKIIFTKTWYHHNLFLREANKKDVETILLFFTGPTHHLVYGSLSSRTVPIGRKLKIIFKRIQQFVTDFVFHTIDFMYSIQKSIQYKKNVSQPNKIGIFNEYERTIGRAGGYDAKSVCVVGSPDFQITHELKSKINANRSLRSDLLGKYGLNENKLKILFIIYRFYSLPPLAEHRMSIQEHLSHHQGILRTIRTVFSEKEADILLKMHPGEKMIYDSYKNLGVKIYHDESRTDELVCLSDLYIADPTTHVNNMAFAIGIPALFINFSKLHFLNNLMEYFHIKHIVTDREDFIEKLRQFKQGALEKQYENSSIDFGSVDNLIKFIG